MKISIRFSVVIIFLILALLMSVSFTRAQGNMDPFPQSQTSSYPNLPWASQYVQQDLSTPLDVGSYVSLALRHVDDYPVMSYYDATNGNLMLAWPVLDHSGNCGTNNNWICGILDDGDSPEDNVGKYTSIDLWGNTANSWKLGVSYYDAWTHSLKAIIWTCSYATCNSDKIIIHRPFWQINTYAGLSTSIKFNSAGVPSIAYYVYDTIASDILYYAYPVPSGGNCGDGDDAYLWQCDIIDYGDLLGQFASFDIGWDGKQYIAYYDGSAGNLKIAIHTGSGNCGPSHDWSCGTLDGAAGPDVGLYASLKAPQFSGDPIRIAYYDKTNGNLKYYDSAGLKMTVDEMGTSLEPMGISMALDDAGLPVIAYQQIASEFSHPVLRIARPYQVFHDNQNGNCGETPPGYEFQIWRCNTIDNAGQHTWEANFASVVVNSLGFIEVAYSEYDDYHDATSLKFIYQTLLFTFMPITIK